MRDLLPVLRWPLLRPLGWLAFLVPAMAGAQPPAVANAAPAAVPQAPHAPLAYTPMQRRPGVDAPLADWRAAHQAVAAFPRGHADIVRWEAGQGAAPAAHHQDHTP